MTDGRKEQSNLHLLAAKQLELAAAHNRRAAECYEQGDIEQARHTADGELHLHARHAIELHCGEASFRMSADGRIELRGSTLVSHATGLNRIRGASVKLN